MSYITLMLSKFKYNLYYFYTNNTNFYSCHTTSSLSTALSRILPIYLVTYIPITVVMLVNPYLYKSSMKNMEDIIIGNSCQITIRERNLMDLAKFKFFVINITFYICWLPNLINGIMIWIVWFHLPLEFTIIIWYLMAITNPLQALFNCIAYKRWRKGDKVQLPWKFNSKESKVDQHLLLGSRSPSPKIEEEKMHLLQSIPKNAINNYKTYT